MRGDVMGIALDFGARVGHRHGKPAIPHDRKINHVVTRKGSLAGLQMFLLQNFPKHGELVLNALMHMLQFQVTSPQGNRLGDALGNQAHSDTPEPGQRNSRAVVRIKTLGFDQALAVETKSALAAMFGRLLENALLRSGRSGKDEQFSVGEDAIHVKEQQFDFLGAGLRGEFLRHRGILASAARIAISFDIKIDFTISVTMCYDLLGIFAMPAAKREYHNTTVRLPRKIYERAKASAQHSETASSFNEFVVQAIEEKVQRLTEADLDAAFAEMAHDQDYQRSSAAMSREFEKSDWEALRPTAPAHESRQLKTRASQARTR